MAYECITNYLPDDDFYARYAPLVTVLPLCDTEREMAAYLCSFDYDDDECECDKWGEYGL